MPRFCANLTMMFTEYPLTERFAAARAAGFDTVEILFPYEQSAAEILERIQQNNLTLALINGPPPNYTDGPRGFAAIPGGQDRFRYDFKRALRYAQTLGARHLHLMSGVAEGAEAKQAMIENLLWATAQAPKQRITIEPINPHDMPGYFMNDFDLAMEVIQTVASPNLYLQFDAYHAHRIMGDVLGTWAKVRRRVSHVQVGGYPGRHEPMACDIDYPAFFAQLDAEGYEGWVSGEYNPTGRTEDGLQWCR